VELGPAERRRQGHIGLEAHEHALDEVRGAHQERLELANREHLDQAVALGHVLDGLWHGRHRREATREGHLLGGPQGVQARDHLDR
jgi:hypothetical protein